ncbi:MAG: hypothetical protein ACKVI4_14785 [Actinomycetales bacterium]|tara:strand:+ start:917 stop:1117 length:201 start_codon:yes stop_codon:yes gene_type:complete
MANSLAETLINAWLCTICLSYLLPRPQPDVVYVQQTGPTAAGAAGDDLPLVACATMQRDSAPHEKV